MAEDSEGDDQEWHELDQASVRKSLRDLLRYNMPDGYKGQMAAYRRFMDILYEEMAQAAKLNVNGFIEFHERKTRADAQLLADTLERNLSALGLTLTDPASGCPVRITPTPTPPRNENETWLQIEPREPVAGSLPKRMSEASFHRFDLARALPPDRSSNRGRR